MEEKEEEKVWREEMLTERTDFDFSKNTGIFLDIEREDIKGQMRRKKELKWGGQVT